MNRLRITSALALAAAAVIGLAATAAAGDFVPLKGIFVGDVIHTTIDSTHDRVDIEASGTAALLGHFNLDVPHVVDRTRVSTSSVHDQSTQCNPATTDSLPRLSVASGPGSCGCCGISNLRKLRFADVRMVI